MKKAFGFLVAGLLLAGAVSVNAQNATQPMLNAWRVVSGYILPNNSANGLRVPALGSTGNPCLSVGTTGIFATTTCGSGGAGATTTINGFSGPAFTFSTGTMTGLDLRITGSGSTITFSPSLQSGYVIPLTASTTEWSTAYGWGNHASAGYLTSSALTPYLTTTTAASTYQPIGSYLTAETDPIWTAAKAAYLTTTTAASTYQPLDTDLTAIAGLGHATGTLIGSTASAWQVQTAGTAGQFLRSSSTSATGLDWAAAGGSGTVTSVDMTVPTGLTVSGNPVTTSGTLAVALAAGYTIPTTTLLNSLSALDANVLSKLAVSTTTAGSTFYLSTSTNSIVFNWPANLLSTTTAAATYEPILTKGNLTATSPLQFDNTRQVIGGAAVVSVASGYNIPLTASTTEWSNFHTTPSGRITAGTNLAWSGNTLNGNMASSTIIAGGTATHSPSITFATSSDTNLLLSIVCATATCTFNPTWTGTLAAARLNSNVVQGITNDTNVTGSISAQNLTLGWTGVLSIARGGTATTSSPTVIGQVLAAHSNGGWGVTNLVAGANITLTTSTPGQITITGAAGGSGNSAWTIGNGLIYNATSTDEVGIGTSTPDNTFTIQGNGATNPLRIASSTGANLLSLNTSGNLTVSGTLTAGAGTLTSLDTGQGAYELYAMDQNVLTTSDVTFGTVVLTGVVNLGAGNVMLDQAGAGLLAFAQNGGVNAILDVTALTDADKTFTFPDLTGTFALLQGTQTFSGLKTFTATTTMATTSITALTVNTINGGTIAGSNSGDVTLAGENYASLSGQQITFADVNLGSNVTSVLPIANGGTATTTSPTNIGQLLASHASGSWGVTTLINGAGITVTTSTAGSLTIASTLGTAIDISAETNLTAGDGLTLTDDDLDCDTATGAIFGCLAAADWLTFNNKLSGSLTSGYIVKASGASTTANSILFELSGKLGVNTTTPIQTLNVVGSAGTNPFAVSSSTGATLFSINSFGTTTIANLVNCDTIDTDSSGNLKCGNDASGASSGNAAWTILSGVIHNATSTDEVGIGTTTPDYTLTIQGNGATNYFRIASSTGANVLAVENSPTPGLSIGTSSTASTLFIQGHSTAPTSNLIVAASSSGTSMLTLTPTGNLTVAGSFTAASITNILDDLGQTSLADPAADQIVFWDDSDTQFEFLSTLSGLAISGNTLTVNDVTCTDCLNATEIEDIYLLLAGDTSSGNYTWSGTHAFNASTTMASTTITGAANIIGNLNISGGLTLGNDLAVVDGGSGAGTFTDHGVLVGSGTGAFTALSVGTNGQLLVGSTGADPVFATANCGANLTCTLGAGTFQIDLDATLSGLTGITSTGAIDFGGAVLEIPNGTNPTADDPGELAHDTTDNQLILDDFVMARAVDKLWSVTVASTSVAFIQGGLMPVPVDIDGYTMTAIRCKVDGGTSKVVAVEDASGNSTEDITCGTTVTSDDGSITNATATAAEEMYIDFGSTSGSVDYVTISVFGTLTRE